MKKLSNLLAIIGIVLLSFSIPVSAQATGTDGSEDSTFGTSGLASAPSANDGDGVRGVIVQPSGKIVAIGYVASPNYIHGWDYRAARFNQDGSLDSTFGTNGVYDNDITGRHDVPRGYAVQPDGKIILAGDVEYPGGGRYRITLMRITPNGQLDTTFGDAGIWMDDRNLTSNIYRATATPAGKIIVTGRDRDLGRSIVFQLNSNGTLDTSFGSGGYLYFPDNGAEKHGVGVAVDSQGKIVVAGISGDNAYAYRLNADGSPDVHFGTAGILDFQINGTSVDFNTVIQVGTGYLITGSATNPSTETKNIVAFRLTHSGNLDSTFGTSGIAFIAPDTVSNVEARASLVSKNGVIYLSGYKEHNGVTTSLLVALNPNGSIATNFGTAGFATGQADFYESIGIQPDGKILAGGQKNAAFALERFSPATTSELAAKRALELANTGKDLKQEFVLAIGLLLAGVAIKLLSKKVNG